MKEFFQYAIDNITRHGDTDIFPFPIENFILRDKQAEFVSLLRKSFAFFGECFIQNPPSHITTLVPVGVTGFRAATQQDPFWNAFFLGITLSIADKIESVRIPAHKSSVFSYRISSNFSDGDIFNNDINWRTFIARSIELAKEHKYVVVCDIADCYQRIYHHRLENALKQLNPKGSVVHDLMEILKNFSNTKSYGVPVGGPTARMLVELVLNLTDQLLRVHNVKFCRYADDYHIFVDDFNEAYEKLVFVSEKLLRNEGLSIQKSKTRIMSSAEFVGTQTLLAESAENEGSDLSSLFSMKLRFDPYSSSAEEDYERLKEHLNQIDILGILNKELSKSRIHVAVAKRLVAAIRHLDNPSMNDAVLTLLNNLDSLYSIFPVVAITLKSCFKEMSWQTKEKICFVIREKIAQGNYLLKTELHAAFAVRILSEMKSAENEDALITLHTRFPGPLVRRDVILTMAKWNEFFWLSDQINDYPGASAWEQRAFIIASYKLGDAGSNWRDHMKAKFDPFENLVRIWASEKVPQANWEIPI